VSDKPSVVEIQPDAERAAQVARSMRRQVQRAVRNQGRALAGFALVTWTMDGDVRTAVLCAGGLVADPLVATVAQNALNVHQAANCAHKFKVMDE